MDSVNIDLAEAFERKMEKNEEKWPVELFGEGKSDEEKRRAYYNIKAKYRGGHPLADGGDDNYS